MIEIGQVVIYNNIRRHTTYPEHYPEVGTQGVVVHGNKDPECITRVQWPHGSTSGSDIWYAQNDDLTICDENIFDINMGNPIDFRPDIVLTNLEW